MLLARRNASAIGSFGGKPYTAVGYFKR